MLDSPQAYLDAAPDAGRPWLEEFWAHVHDRCPGLEWRMKGSVSVKYANEAAKPALRAFVDEVLTRHGMM